MKIPDQLALTPAATLGRVCKGLFPMNIENPTRRDAIRAAGLMGLLALESKSQGAPHPGLSGIPFSRFGSYWVVSKRWDWGSTDATPAGQWYIRLLQDDANPSELFRIEVQVAGIAVPFEAAMTPGRLTLSTASGATLEFVVSETDVLRVRGRGCVLRLYTIKGPYGYAIPGRGDDWEVMGEGAMPRVQVRPLAGRLKVDARWEDKPHMAACTSITVDMSGDFDCALHYYDGVPRRGLKHVPFDAAVAAVEHEFREWSAPYRESIHGRDAARDLAAYVTWSIVVGPRGLYRTPVVLGSKSWMNRVWSWDHCFSSIGLARAAADLSWQQFAIFKDMQDPASGVLSDWMSNTRRSWLCTKPPVHGWTLTHLLSLMPHAVTPARLAEIYQPLRRWTEFWLTERTLDGDGLPCILNPNESFDNTTANTLYGPVKPPEIAAYLVLQLECLAGIAARMGRQQEAAHWRKRSKDVLDALVRVLWDERKQTFIARRVGDGQTGKGDCLFSFVPLVLGKRLPERISKAMVRGVSQPGRFLTKWGLATEALSSPLHDDNTYVKGPVWAPPNVFIIEGLDALGEHDLAARIRNSFLDACAAGGMTENFNSTTGAPQRDPAYNWTAAMFLHLARVDQRTINSSKST